MYSVEFVFIFLHLYFLFVTDDGSVWSVGMNK